MRATRRHLGHTAGMAASAGPARVGARRAEVLAALSIAIDLGLGLPMEHVLRSSLIASILADELGLDDEQRATTYYTNLVLWIGCHADSHEFSGWFGDDLATRSGSYEFDWSGLPYFRFLLSRAGSGQPVPQRAQLMLAMLPHPAGADGGADPLPLHVRGSDGRTRRSRPGRRRGRRVRLRTMGRRRPADPAAGHRDPARHPDRAAQRDVRGAPAAPRHLRGAGDGTRPQWPAVRPRAGRGTAPVPREARRPPRRGRVGRGPSSWRPTTT